MPQERVKESHECWVPGERRSAAGGQFLWRGGDKSAAAAVNSEARGEKGE